MPRRLVETPVKAPSEPKTAPGNPLRSPGFWGAATFGAVLSLVVTGYASPYNNVFHLPIVALLYDRPEFADDVFIQSLRYYSSGVWMLLAGSAEWIEPRTLFLVLLLLSRLLSLVGFLACADHFGIRKWRLRLLFAALIAVTPLMRAVAYAGDGGLFIDYFTHSEIANGLFLLAVWALLSDRLALSIAMIGLTFFVNAFFGVWLAFVLAFVLVWLVATGDLPLRRLAPPVAVGSLLSLAFALPVVLDILRNPGFGRTVGFDYVGFLDFYFPYHFLIWAMPGMQVIGLLSILALAGAALWKLRDSGPRMAMTLAACVLLYILGMAAPWMTGSPSVLNLHLLRSGVTIHMLAALLLTTLLVRWRFGPDRVRASLAAVVMVVLAGSLALPEVRPLIYLAILPVLAYDGASAPLPGRDALVAWLGRRRRLVGRAALAVTLLLGAGYAFNNHHRIAGDDALRSEWTQVADWARKATGAGAVFMVPDGAGADFETRAHRSIWVDLKRGAAVMWHPAYHDVWRERLAQQDALGSLAERVAYAQANGISYIVDPRPTDCGGSGIFSTEHLCVIDVANAARAASPSSGPDGGDDAG